MATVARTSDAELLLRLRRRDREAWEELYAEYQPRLRGFAYRLAGNVHDADDLVQETFVRAVPRLDRLDPETADVSAYLFTTLRNLFLKQVERTKRQQPVAVGPEPVLPTPIEDYPERGTLLRGLQDVVRLANARLLPRQRLVLALRVLEDLGERRALGDELPRGRVHGQDLEDPGPAVVAGPAAAHAAGAPHQAHPAG